MNKETISIIDTLKWYDYMGINDIIDYNISLIIHMTKHKSTKQSNNIAKNTIVQVHTYPITLQSNSRKIANSCYTLEDLKSAVSTFEECSLKKAAINTVFGDGVTTAPIMLIGEAPGQNEDKQGIPFCGESGKLLDNMLKAINLSRIKNVYITNTVFWRPPGNRRPTSEEIELCRPFVEKHIAIINPKLIILVGSTAATSLLGDHVKISKIRQEYFSYNNHYLNHNIPVTAIFHPAYMLRQPQQKKASWYDLLRIQKFIKDNVIL